MGSRESIPFLSFPCLYPQPLPPGPAASPAKCWGLPGMGTLQSGICSEEVAQDSKFPSAFVPNKLFR